MTARRPGDADLIRPFLGLRINPATKDVRLPTTQRLPHRPHAPGGIHARIDKRVAAGGSREDGGLSQRLAVANPICMQADHAILTQPAVEDPGVAIAIDGQAGIVNDAEPAQLRGHGNRITFKPAQFQTVGLAVEVDKCGPDRSVLGDAEIGEVQVPLGFFERPVLRNDRGDGVWFRFRSHVDAHGRKANERHGRQAMKKVQGIDHAPSESGTPPAVTF